MSEENSRDSVVSTGGWFVFLLLMAIPFVNIIIIFVEAFGSGSNRNKAGLCRAMLIWWLIGVAGSIAFLVLCGAAVTEFVKNLNTGEQQIEQSLDGYIKELQNEMDKQYKDIKLKNLEDEKTE